MVEYIEYNGKRYPVRVSYFVLQNFKKETGKTFDQAQQEMKKTGDMSMFETVLWLALQSGARKTREPLVVTEFKNDGSAFEREMKKEDMEFVLDDCFKEFMDLLEKMLPADEEGAEAKKPQGNRAQRRAQEKAKKK